MNAAAATVHEDVRTNESFDEPGKGRGGAEKGLLIIMHGRSLTVIRPRIPPEPGRSTPIFRRPGRRGGWGGGSEGLVGSSSAGYTACAQILPPQDDDR